jgi:hypothetical protein
MKRFRLRFSICTLAIFVTLVCCYAACWGPTNTRGVEDVVWHQAITHPVEVSTTIPLVVGINSLEGTRRCYYFWFFGYVAKLPWEREVLVEDYEDP